MKLISALHHANKNRVFSTRQILVLMLLNQQSPIGFSALARDARMVKPALSRAVEALTILGMTERARIDDDKRLCEISLTPAGRAFVKGLEGR